MMKQARSWGNFLSLRELAVFNLLSIVAIIILTMTLPEWVTVALIVTLAMAPAIIYALLCVFFDNYTLPPNGIYIASKATRNGHLYVVLRPGHWIPLGFDWFLTEIPEYANLTYSYNPDIPDGDTYKAEVIISMRLYRHLETEKNLLLNGATCTGDLTYKSNARLENIQNLVNIILREIFVVSDAKSRGVYESVRNDVVLMCSPYGATDAFRGMVEDRLLLHLRARMSDVYSSMNIEELEISVNQSSQSETVFQN